MTEALQASLAEAAKDPRRVEATRPEVAAEAITLLMEGVSETAVERKTGISKRTVYALRVRHNEVLKLGREEAARRAGQLAEKARSLALVRLQIMDPREATDEADRQKREALLLKINPRDLAVSYGVATDKGERLATEAPAQVSASVPSLESCRNALEEARALSAERRRAEEQQRQREMEKQIAEQVQRQLEEREGAAATVVELSPGRDTAGARLAK